MPRFSATTCDSIMGVVAAVDKVVRDMRYDASSPIPKNGTDFDKLWRTIDPGIKDALCRGFRQLGELKEMPTPIPAKEFYTRIKTSELQVDLGSGDGIRSVKTWLTYSESELVYDGPDLTLISEGPAHPSIVHAACDHKHFHCRNAKIHVRQLMVDAVLLESLGKMSRAFYLTSFNFLPHVSASLQSQIFSFTGVHYAPSAPRLLERGEAEVDPFDGGKLLVKYKGSNHIEHKVVPSARSLVSEAGSYMVIFTQRQVKIDVVQYNPEATYHLAIDPKLAQPVLRRPTPIGYNVSGRQWKVKNDGVLMAWVVDGSTGTAARFNAKFYRTPATVSGTWDSFDVKLSLPIHPMIFTTERIDTGRSVHHVFLGFNSIRGIKIQAPLVEQRQLFRQLFSDVKGIDIRFPRVYSRIDQTVKSSEVNDGIVDVTDIVQSAFKALQTIDIMLGHLPTVINAIEVKTGYEVELSELSEPDDVVYEFNPRFLNGCIYLDPLRPRFDKTTSNNLERIHSAVEHALTGIDSVEYLLKAERELVGNVSTTGLCVG